MTSVFTVDPDALAVAAGVAGWFDNLFVFEPAPADDRTLNQRILRIAKIRGDAAMHSSVDIFRSLAQGS